MKAKAGADVCPRPTGALESDGSTGTKVGNLLHRLVEEYHEERREVGRLRAESARLDAENKLLTVMLESTRRPSRRAAAAGSEVEERPGAVADARKPSRRSAAGGEVEDCPGAADPGAEWRRTPSRRSAISLEADGTMSQHSIIFVGATEEGGGGPPPPEVLVAGVSSGGLPGQVTNGLYDPDPPAFMSTVTPNSNRFDLRDAWKQAEDEAPMQLAGCKFVYTDLADEESIRLKSNTHQINYDGFWRCIISHPFSPTRLVWCMIGAALVMYDMIVIPLQVFEVDATTLFAVMDWVTLLYWTLDMLLSPFVGYVSRGVVEMRPSKVFLHYVSSGRWLMDMIVVVPDWTFTLVTLGYNNDAGNSVKLLKMLRITRTMRLMRLHKLKWILATINDMIDSEYINILVGIAKMLLFLMMINHFLACAWYATTLLAPSGSHTWVEVHSFDDHTWPYKYATSFHWAITQFTPASMHVQPQNLSERGFAIAVVIFALVGFSYIVGSISASLAKIRGMKEENAHQFWNLKRYLKQNEVPQQLRVRIIRYGEHAVQLQKERVTLEGNKIYQLISEQLRNELACAITAPHLCVHPLFDHLRVLADVTLRRLADSAISYKQVGCAETVFHPGEKATHMYFVIEGQLSYKSTVASGEEELVDCNEDWISEPALWTAVWQHLGALVALKESSLLRVDAISFCHTVRLTPQAFSQIKAYACKFIEWLNLRELTTLSDIGQGEVISQDLRSFIPAEEAASH